MARSSRTPQTDLLDRLVAELQEKLNQSDAIIAERDAAITEREIQLRQRDVTVAALQEQIRQLESALGEESQAEKRLAALSAKASVPLPGRARRGRAVWLPVLFVGLAILFLILHQTGILAPVEGVLQVVIAPLQQQTTRLVTGVGDLFQSVRDARLLRTEVEELQEQVDALGVENVRLREFEAEAIQLRSMLTFADENPTWAFLGADVVGWSACANVPCGTVIGVDPSSYLRYVSVNVGMESGVGVGMPVVAGGAVLVGRTAEVGLYSSKVRLLNDPGSGVAAFLQESRATGIVAGQPDGSLLMIYIPQEEQIQEGEIVLSSGAGGVLPRGLIIGQVVEVRQQDTALFQEAVVRPALDYRRTELMLIISSFHPLVREGSETAE